MNLDVATKEVKRRKNQQAKETFINNVQNRMDRIACLSEDLRYEKEQLAKFEFVAPYPEEEAN